jgi:hypothetical protein
VRRGRGRERGRTRVQSDFIFHNFLFFVNKVRDATRRHYARPSTALFLVSDAQLIMNRHVSSSSHGKHADGALSSV